MYDLLEFNSTFFWFLFMSSRLHHFETRFLQFCELFRHCDKSHFGQMERLYTEFQTIQHLGQDLSNTSIDHLSSDHKLLWEYFDFGKENYHNFCAPYISLINDDKHTSTQRIMGEYKRPDALNSLIQNHPTDLKIKQKLQELVGGPAGLGTMDDFVAKIRMERLSQIMGYVLSGVAQDDLAMYYVKKQLSSKVFKYRNQSVEDFLTQQMVERDMDFVVHATDGGFGTVALAGTLSPIKTTPPMFFETSSNNLAPASLFINHNQKRVTAVVTNMIENSTQVLVATHQSLKNLVALPAVGSTDNPLYGYSIEMCVFHSGASFQADATHTITSYLYDLKNASDRLRQTLMRGAFLNLVGSAIVGKTLRDTLRDTNIHVLGTDSEKLYHAMRMAAAVDQHDIKSREMGDVVLGEMHAILTSNLESDFISSLTPSQLILIKKSFGSVVQTALHYFSIFPLKNNQKLTLSEKKKLHNVANMVDKLNPLLGDGTAVNLSRLWGMDQVENTARTQSQNSSLAPLGYIYSSDIQSDMQRMFVMHQETQHKKQIICGVLLDHLSRSQVPDCFQEFLNHARADTVTNPLPSSDKAREFFADVQRMCAGKKSLNALSSQEANLNNPRAAFRRWINQVSVHLFEKPTVAGESVVVLSELFNTSLWTDRSLIPFSPKMKSVVENISHVMLAHAQHPTGADLSSLLDNVYQTPRRKLH